MTPTSLPKVDLSTLTSLFSCEKGGPASMRGKLLMVVGTAEIEAPNPIYAPARPEGWSYAELCRLIEDSLEAESAAQRAEAGSEDHAPLGTLLIERKALGNDDTDKAGSNLLILAREYPVLVVATGFLVSASHQYADYAAGVDEQGLPVVLKNRYRQNG